nr:MULTISPECIES: ATP-grasp domain-containing protein [unclassified Arthrobacter]
MSLQHSKSQGETQLSSWPSHFEAEVVREAFGTRLAGYTIALEAWRRGLQVRFFDSQLRRYELSDGRTRIRFNKTRPSLTTRAAIAIEQNKHSTNSRLRAAGVPVPASWVLDPFDADVEDELLTRAEDTGYPLVLKPLRGSMGRDVLTNLRTRADLLDTFRYLSARCTKGEKLILESHFEGEDYRVLVVGDRVVAACLRRPANVVGDGASTVQELIVQKNKVRLENPYLCKKLIGRDREVDQYLQRQGYGLGDIPFAGVEVRLRGKANASQGGDSIDKTAELPTAVKNAAVRAVAAVPGLAIAGVDILFDANRTPVEDSFRVIEMNSRPEIEINMYPWKGAGQDVPQHILDVFFPSSTRSDAPRIQKTGLNLKQLLAPLQGASANEVLVKTIPAHAYPARQSYWLREKGDFSATDKNLVYLAARRAGVSGRVETVDGVARLLLAGTEESIRKFLRSEAQRLGVDTGSEEQWNCEVAQGFYFNS